MNNIFFSPVGSFLRCAKPAVEALKRLKISNVRDLVFYKPASYNLININPDLGSVRHGELIQTEVTIEDVQQPRLARMPLKIKVTNPTGMIILVFFGRIHPYIYSKLRVGQKYSISGKAEVFEGQLQISHPDFIFKKNLASPVVPVYPLTYGLTNKQLYGYILDAIAILENAHNARKAFASDSAEEKKYMGDLLAAIKKLHLVGMPPNHEVIEKVITFNIRKLAAKELFANQAALRMLKVQESQNRGRKFAGCPDLQKTILAGLGFKLTADQEKAVADIEGDQASSTRMTRLLQGDVGSGKTLVALLGILNVVKTGAQAALMAPTDLLSVQHYQFFCRALESSGIRAGLLTGKMTPSQQKRIKQELAAGQLDILIGTHALFQSGVEFRDLGYIVIDEQHRFGVEQRLELIKKASCPDVLVMSATPIPRSLALTMFGDMSASQIKTKPANRLPVITSVVPNEKRREVIASLAKKLQSGEKIYWVCPLIDEADSSLDQITGGEEPQNLVELANVTARFAELDQAYPGQTAILHGKMKGTQKDQVMEEFRDGKINILVTTTVIEVGIDVPESTLIVIENAEKFGLAQLHQLRGRVGRGIRQSYCLLMYNSKRLSNTARERLKIMRISNDGFYIAEQDLILRGGGEILGAKQSGEPVFFFANLGRDLQILLEASVLAEASNRSDFIDFQISLFARSPSYLSKSG